MWPAESYCSGCGNLYSFCQCWQEGPEEGDEMPEKDGPTLQERLEHFEQNRIAEGDRYGAEVLHRAQQRIFELEADKKRLDWLEAHGMKISRPNNPDFVVFPRELPGSTFREAIDKAMEEPR